MADIHAFKGKDLALSFGVSDIVGEANMQEITIKQDYWYNEEKDTQQRVNYTDSTTSSTNTKKNAATIEIN